MSIQIFRRRAALVFSLVLTLSVGGALRGEDKPKAKSPAAESAAKKFVVPEGGVPELVKFLKELKLNRPRSIEERDALFTAGRTAAEKILGLEKDTKSETYQEALAASLQAGAQLIASWDKDEQKKELDRLEQFLTGRPVTGLEANLAMTTASSLERSGNLELGAEAFRRFGELFAKSSDAKAKQYGGMMAGAARRLGLVGKPLELAGTKVDGEKFEIAALKGKVVLVDFWATWCGPCIAEYPNMKKNYEAYHAKGFEIVGVSIDQDRSALEKYLTDKSVPWITLHERDANGQHPATEHYGIFGIPAMFLVGRNGKVLSINARGKELDKLLEEEFSKPEPSAKTGG